MSTFLFVYHGGDMPQTESEAQQVFTDWKQWMVDIGEEAVIDSGNPVGKSSTVLADGQITDDGGANPVSGYGVFSADSLQEALDMAQGCPIRQLGGSIEVAEIHDVSM